jgi:phosphoribosylformimino-5-aminoimidazole carboxamide ribotide isomerase
MLIIPAIDLQNGEAVRLFQGDYSKKTVYGSNPAAIARGFQNMGAKYLHVVDLDGAKDGNTANIETIRKIREAISIPIQLGGGIRNAETVAMYLNEIKIDRVILGTIAIKNPAFVREMLTKHGAEKIVVGVDVRDGMVSTAGWREDSDEHYLRFIESLKTMGVKYIVVTDIIKDGSLTSPNWEMYEKIKDINFVVSGGVSCEADIKKAKNYYAVIVGKAYYEGKVDLKKMLKKRIIPCLDIKNGKVVKGINFVNLTNVGDPVEISRQYQEQGAEEIVFLDITAENREAFYELLQRASAELSIPVTVGGGIRSIEDFRETFARGASKVSVNTAAVLNPRLIK